MALRSLKDRRALVTGASGGIGRSLAIELARAGVDLVLVARREEKLQAVAEDVNALGRRAILVVGDVTDPEVRSAALDAARDQLGGLDILVNNAGVSAHGRFADADPNRLRTIMELNFFAAVELIREALPLLKAGQHPAIVNISSVLGRVAVPRKSEYSASKFALSSFSDSLRAELASDGFQVLVVSPSTTNTEFFDNLIEDQGHTPFNNPKGVSPDHVARRTVRAIRWGWRHEITPSFTGKLLVLAGRLCPRIVHRILTRWG